MSFRPFSLHTSGLGNLSQYATQIQGYRVPPPSTGNALPDITQTYTSWTDIDRGRMPAPLVQTSTNKGVSFNVTTKAWGGPNLSYDDQLIEGDACFRLRQYGILKSHSLVCLNYFQLNHFCCLQQHLGIEKTGTIARRLGMNVIYKPDICYEQLADVFLDKWTNGTDSFILNKKHVSSQEEYSVRGILDEWKEKLDDYHLNIVNRVLIEEALVHQDSGRLNFTKHLIEEFDETFRYLDPSLARDKFEFLGIVRENKDKRREMTSETQSSLQATIAVEREGRQMIRNHFGNSYASLTNLKKKTVHGRYEGIRILQPNDEIHLVFTLQPSIPITSNSGISYAPMVVIPSFGNDIIDISEQIQRDNWLSLSGKGGKFPYLGSKERIERFRKRENEIVEKIRTPEYITHSHEKVSIFLGSIMECDKEDYHNKDELAIKMGMGDHVNEPSLYDACLQARKKWRFWTIYTACS